MWQVVAGVLQIIYLFMKNKFEKDSEIRKQKDDMYVEIKEAVKSRDVSKLNSCIQRLR